MSPKDQTHRCPKAGKIIYHSAAHAAHGVAHFKHRHDRCGKRREPMEAYQCHFCTGWHVGHAKSAWR